MKKKILFSLFVLFALFFLVGFAPRFSAPARDNYFYSSGNLYHQHGWPMPNCAAYAWGRIHELTGAPPRVNPGHAKTWYGTGGYAVGSLPALGAVMAWNGGSMGHVAIVEQIHGDGTITVSESHSSGTYFNTARLRVDGSDYVGFQGYIYTVHMPAPQPVAAPAPPAPQPANAVAQAEVAPVVEEVIEEIDSAAIKQKAQAIKNAFPQIAKAQVLAKKAIEPTYSRPNVSDDVYISVNPQEVNIAVNTEEKVIDSQEKEKVIARAGVECCVIGFVLIIWVAGVLIQHKVEVNRIKKAIRQIV